MKILGTRVTLRLDTRKQNQIENECDHEPVTAGEAQVSERHRVTYQNVVHRRTQPTRRYNCHGLTFGSRRTRIWNAEAVRRILSEDDYRIIAVNDVEPGDIAVYYLNGDVEHSGVVVSVSGLKVPIVLSKWGDLHEVIHQVPLCPYDSTMVVYYRIES